MVASAKSLPAGSVAKNILAAISRGSEGCGSTTSGVVRNFLQHYPSKTLANLLKSIINDSEKLVLNTLTLPADQLHTFVDGGRAATSTGGYITHAAKSFYFNDYMEANAKDPRFAAALLGHVLKEGHEFMLRDLHGQYRKGTAHEVAMEFEALVLSDFTGKKEQGRVEVSLQGGIGVRFEYTSIAYDVYHKQFGPLPSNTVILVNDKNCRCKK